MAVASFTEAEDSTIIEMRRAGVPWAAISARLRRPASTLGNRCARIAPELARPKTQSVVRRAGAVVETEERHRAQVRDVDPMPAFADVSWSAIWLPCQLPAGEGAHLDSIGAPPAGWTGEGGDGQHD